MDWGNAFIRSKQLSASGQVESIEAELYLEGDFKKTSKKIHWLATSSDAPLVNVTLIDFDYLITKKKIEDTDDWADYINPITEFKTAALADANVTALKQGDIIQFERKGYYIVDRAVSEAENGDMEFILIPDGKATSVALKAKENSGPSQTIFDSSNKINGFNTPVNTTMYSTEPFSEDAKMQTDYSKVKMYKINPVSLQCLSPHGRH